MTKLVEPPADWDCGIIISDIRRSGEPHTRKFEATLDGAVEYWGQDYTPSGPLCALVTAAWASGDIVVRVELDCGFCVPCYRCLTETGIAIKGDMRYIFSLRPGDDEDGEPDGEADIIRLEPCTAEIDMTPYIWETMILNLPERVSCAEDCRGLCAVCGTNRNDICCGCSEDGIDPRLEVLKKLM